MIIIYVIFGIVILYGIVTILVDNAENKDRVERNKIAKAKKIQELETEYKKKLKELEK